MTKKDVVPGSKTLKNAKHELFCHLYSGQHNMQLFGNGTQCYSIAYGYSERIDAATEKIAELQSKGTAKYTVRVKALEATIRRMKNVCSVEASRVLVNPSIRARCDFLLRSTIGNEFADQELQYVILQRKDLNAKVQAIREHNRVSQRVKEGVLEGHFTVEWAGDE